MEIICFPVVYPKPPPRPRTADDLVYDAACWHANAVSWKKAGKASGTDTSTDVKRCKEKSKTAMALLPLDLQARAREIISRLGSA